MFVVSNSRPFNLVMIWVMVKLKMTVMKKKDMEMKTGPGNVFQNRKTKYKGNRRNHWWWARVSSRRFWQHLRKPNWLLLIPRIREIVQFTPKSKKDVLYDIIQSWWVRFVSSELKLRLKKFVHKCKQTIISKKQKQKKKNDGNKKVPIRPLVWKVVQRLIWYGKESFKLINILLLPFPNHNFLSKFYLMTTHIRLSLTPKICGRTAHCKQ